MSQNHFLGFDFGAESGRAIIGTLSDGKLSLKEIHRFPTGFLLLNGKYQWNVYRMLEEVIKALRICVQQEGIQPESIGIDTWGVDYGLIASDGCLLGLPYSYRDPRTDTAMDEFFKIMPREKLYEKTGIQFMQFNTIFQLFAAKRDLCPMLANAEDLLFIADLFNYFLTGVKKNEFTFATTSQLFNPKIMNWDSELIETLKVDPNLFSQIIYPGEIIGELKENYRIETGMNAVPVVAVATHDTGSAIVSVPAFGSDFAYISSGTWSLMGLENSEAVITPASLANNITNEGGAFNTWRYLKNIMGLWLIQQTRKAWLKEKEYSYPELVQMSQNAPAFSSLIDPDDHSFMRPDDMPEAIREFCRKTGQAVPDTKEKIVRIIFESLALKYKYTLNQLVESSRRDIRKIHIIGGGTQNELLNQYTANACGLPVIAGPAEATAIGNIMVQTYARGFVKSLDEIRQIIRNSFELKEFLPQDSNAWKEAYEKFITLVK